MSFLLKTIFHQVDKAAQEEVDPIFDNLEVQEELEDSRFQYKVVMNEMAEAAKEALSVKTIQKYEKYIIFQQI